MSAPITQESLQFQGYPRRCVLIIDDDPAFTLLASETLQQAGFDARIASNAKEAVASFERDKPDLVLLDVELPDANGFDLCTSIRAASEGADIPIVMVTGHNDTESIERAFMVGATDFIHKPVLWQTLPQRVEFILRAQDTLQSLRISEQKNRALLQALPDTIYIVDGNGVLLEHITGVERTAASSLVGKHLEDVIPADAARAARQSMTGPIDVKRVTTCEFRGRSRP
jgi:DNA-binding response OmpR family regulator